MAKAKTATKTAAKKKTTKPAAKKSTKRKASTSKPTKKKDAKKTTGDELEVEVDRRDPKAEDRRQETAELKGDAPERRKVARRRQIDPTTCERDYNNDEIEFMHALDAYKRAAGRMFPTCSEILEVVRDLGYHRLNPEQLSTLGLNKPPADETEGADGVVAAGEANALQEAGGFAENDTDDNGMFGESLEDFEG